MGWLSQTFSSSIGRKFIMSLAGLFLVVYLLVHMGINLLVIFYDSPEKFNIAANFMGTNPVIRVFEVVLFLGFILHIVYGLIVTAMNRKARPVSYSYKKDSASEAFSNWMSHTAIIILIFLIIHLMDFYVKAKITHDVPLIEHAGVQYHNLGALIVEKFKMLGYTIFYIVCLLFLGFHLWHGFYSAFQTLGWRHKKYYSLIKGAAVVYTLVVTLGFISIPVYIYFFK